MNSGSRQTLTTRVISTTFVVAALAVFKPFGLEAWQWQAYAHIFNLWIIGIAVCMLTDLILKYLVRMPRSDNKGVSYIIRRNLWFQIINTPLVALSICLYRHFVLSNRMESNHFSLVNFLETLAIIAFCSFAIGLYWRFKFRSRFLSAELEETRMLNEKLVKMQARQAATAPTTQGEQTEQNESPAESGTTVSQSPLRTVEPVDAIVLKGTTNESVSLHIANLLYIEAVGNYVKVCHLHNGQVHTDMLRATSKQMEDDLRPYSMIVRCHRAFLTNLGQVEQIVSRSGAMQLIMKHTHDSLPVSRSNMAQIKKAVSNAL